MTKKYNNPKADWNRLRPDVVHAVGELHKPLDNEESAQDILDAYLYTKKLLAESMKALVLSQLPTDCPAFHELRSKLADEIQKQYGGKIPAKYLTVPYGSRTHEILFAILLQHIREPVNAEFLRYSTKDSIHTERRIRELRGLGIEIDTDKASGANVYTLQSLDIATSLIPVVVKNNLRIKKASDQEKAELLAVLGLEDD
ncbi:hypothetical protein [Nocardia sp. NPDC057030]|uniref:hypothetical protein n=1 Tax=Nocardia sp. NPDC057030 TaxID=3346005 RepID=UPI0036307D0E